MKSKKTKICFKCKKRKKISNFTQYKSGKNKGYYSSYCKPCAYIACKPYYKKESVKKKRNLYKKKWEKENKKLIKDYSKKYYKKHKKHKKEYNKVYCYKNRDKINERRKNLKFIVIIEELKQKI